MSVALLASDQEEKGPDDLETVAAASTALAMTDERQA
jgi:hypothetical protein